MFETQHTSYLYDSALEDFLIVFVCVCVCLMRYNMCVTTRWPADGVYLMCVLILVGAVCQTVSQSHQTLSKTLVDGVTPSRCSNRAWGQHWKTHTHTEKLNWKLNTLCNIKWEIRVSMHYLTISVVLCLLMAAAVGPDWDETSSQLTTLLSKQVFVFNDGLRGLVLSIIHTEYKYFQKRIHPAARTTNVSQLKSCQLSAGIVRTRGEQARQSFYSQFLVHIKIKVGYMHFKGRCQEVMKVRGFFFFIMLLTIISDLR